MMSRKIISYIVFSFILLLSCSKEEIYENTEVQPGVIKITSYPASFTKIEARTAKTPFEMQISNKTMLVFDSNGDLISSQFRTGEDVSFMIDRKASPYIDHYRQDSLLNSNTTIMDQCRIYILANFAQGSLDQIATESDLLALEVRANPNIHLDKLVSFLGLPMTGGVNNVDLNPYKSMQAPEIKPVILKSLYAKVEVDIHLDVEQGNADIIPTFRMNSYTIKNLPAYAVLNETPATDETVLAASASPGDFLAHAGETTLSDGANPISNRGKHLVFNFYVLEHKVNPANHTVDKPFKYPNGIKDNEKQRFKPQLVSENQKPSFVEIDGVYTTHQGIEKKVKYLLYLGENNSDDFHINRNCLLKNVVTIKGLTNSSIGETGVSGESVSVDHRVIVDDSEEDVIIAVEREALLDSHIEIRPLDVQLKTDDPEDKNYVVVELADPVTKETVTENPSVKNNYKWVRFEKKNSAPSGDATYCDNGKRKYFTTDLLTQLNANSNIKTNIVSNGDNRIWVYFDENPNASTSGMRDAMLKFSYYENGGTTPKKVLFYKFRQHDLYPVKVGNTTYYIEYYEEYLYNFDPKDPYTSTKEGMPWGMNVVYSNTTEAITSIDGGILDLNIKGIKDVKAAIVKDAGFYDYENLKDGPTYTQKLISHDGFTILPLDQSPRSAAEYCYNKNKRNADGTVPTMDWYLPAIGELQEITQTAYAAFEVFQDKYYWSSQTSYLPGKWEYQGVFFYEGLFKFEDKQYARATKTKMQNGVVSFESSEVLNNKQYLKANWDWGKAKVNSTMESLPGDPGRQPGNHLRSDELRVRAVRKTLPQGGVER